MIPIHQAFKFIEKATQHLEVSLPPPRDPVIGSRSMPKSEFSELRSKPFETTTSQRPGQEDLPLGCSSTDVQEANKTVSCRSQMSDYAKENSGSTELQERPEPQLPGDSNQARMTNSSSVGWLSRMLRRQQGNLDNERGNPIFAPHWAGQPSTDPDMDEKRSWFPKNRWNKVWTSVLPSSMQDSNSYKFHGANTFMTQAWEFVSLIFGIARPWLSLCFGIGWLVLAVLVLGINLNGQIVGPSIACLHSGQKCRMKLNTPFQTRVQQAESFAQADRNALVGFQLTAKIFDAWFSLMAASFVWSFIESLAGHDSSRSLPIGYIHAHTECSDLRILSKLFWDTRREGRELQNSIGKLPEARNMWELRDWRSRWRWSRRVWLYTLAALLGFICILCNLMGPATAVLVIPSLQWVNINQVQKVWMGPMLSDQGPQYSTRIPGCSQASLQAEKYSCTDLIHSAAMAYVVASATERKRDRRERRVLMEYGPTAFTIDLSTPTLWITAQQILHGFSADLDDFDAATMPGNISSHERPGASLSKRSNPTTSDYIRHGISKDEGGFSTTATTAELSFEEDFEISDPDLHSLVEDIASEQVSAVTVGISMGLGGLNTTVNASMPSSEGYPDSALFNLSLQTRFQRHGPILGQWSACFLANEITDILVDVDRTVRCFNSADSSGPAKCFPQGIGWANIAQVASNFSLHGVQDSSTSLIDVSVYTTSRSLYLSSPISGLDWNEIFTSIHDAPQQNISGPQQTIVYTLPLNSSSNHRLNSTSVWCDLQTTMAFVDYTLDPNSLHHGPRLVETIGHTSLPSQSLFVHSEWALAAWSVDKGSNVQESGGAARALRSAMTSWIANEGSPEASTPFSLIHNFAMAQVLTIMSFNTTSLRPSNTTHNPPLSRKAMVQVWKYGVDSSSSIFGMVIVILGIMVVLARTIFYDRQPVLDATDILVKTLKQSRTPKRPREHISVPPLLSECDSDEEEEDIRKEYPVIQVLPDSSAREFGSARRIPYKSRISFHG
jgi:hypothetical protein